MGTHHPAVGRKLPQLELKPLTGDGRPVSLEDLKGRVTLIDFWGTWCPPCAEELPHIAALATRFSGQLDFQVLAVSCGPDNRNEDFAGIAVYLMSEASSYHTGDCIVIDGGYSAF